MSGEIDPLFANPGAEAQPAENFPIYDRTDGPPRYGTAGADDGVREALAEMLEFCQTQGDFKNGVTYNGIDEGEVWASGVFDKAHAALRAQPPSVRLVEREALKEATREQHFDLPKGEPARFVRNGVLETCQCRDCSALAHQPRSEGSKP